MKHQLEQHIHKNLSFLKDKKLLLATSGGLDSMVMVHLMQQLNFDIAVAHCNFNLRGQESQGDQKFVEEYAKTTNIPCFIIQFDTTKYAITNKLSTQVAARELRYNWFDTLLQEHHFDFLLTAHHADDCLETFFINLARGTGIDGLKGIPTVHDKIVRPLVPFSRDEIANYAAQNNINWREDSSNASDKYLRNKIRHQLVPLLKNLNPDFLTSFQKTQSHLQQTQTMANDAARFLFEKVAHQQDESVCFDLKLLLLQPNYKSYLYYWLNEYGFSAWDDIALLVDGNSGKQIFSEKYRLIQNRDFLILSPKKETKTAAYFIKEKEPLINIPLKLAISKVRDICLSTKSVIFVDEEKLQYPLEIRHWHQGDVFLPFGMKGKSKKVSKFFKDEKFSILDKENTWLLCSNNQVVWIIGHRQDERFRGDTATKTTLKIELL